MIWVLRKTSIVGYKKWVILEDCTLDLKRDQTYERSSWTKTTTIVDDHQEIANTYNSHIIWLHDAFDSI
jgi:hypothetical protein